MWEIETVVDAGRWQEQPTTFGSYPVGIGELFGLRRLGVKPGSRVERRGELAWSYARAADCKPVARVATRSGRAVRTLRSASNTS